MTRSEILKAAERCVCTDRNQQYGEPEDNFRTISMLWSVYLCARGMEQPLGAADVGAMMALFKLGRIATGGDKADNFIDLAGYAACTGEISTESGRTSKDVKVSVGNKGSAEREKTAVLANRIVRMTRSARHDPAVRKRKHIKQSSTHILRAAFLLCVCHEKSFQSWLNCFAV